MAAVTSLKTVIRCRDFAASRTFYSSMLRLEPIEEWDEPQGRGAIFRIGTGDACSLEIYEMTRRDPRYQPAFSEPAVSDKVDLQFRTPSVDAWVERLRGVWAFTGPEVLPWGHRWITLRDPDNLLIAIYEE